MTTFSPTAEQSEAITSLDVNIALSAAAGSGKTTVLTRRFVELLLMDPTLRVNQITAITFTRLAAAEMRNRTRVVLRDIAHEQPHHAQRCRTLLAEMDSARIGTIHAFCGDVLRANPAEARLDPAFEVLEDTQARLLKLHIWTSLEEQLAAHDPDQLNDLLEHYALADVRAVVLRDDLLDAPMPMQDWAVTHQAWQEQAIHEYQHLQLTLRTALDTLNSLFRRNTEDDALRDDYFRLASVLELRFEACVAGLDVLWDGFRTKTGWRAFGKTGKSANWLEIDRAREMIADAVELLRTTRVLLDRNHVRLPYLWGRWIETYRTLYTAAKEQAGVLDFNDLEARTLALLTQHPHVVARYLDREVRQLMVDEFQDTNARQWGIVSHLANIHQPGRLFIVGDARQSIYGFRGADVGVFEGVRAVMQTAGRSLMLTQSNRSTPQLVAFYRDYFGIAAEELTPGRIGATSSLPPVQLLLFQPSPTEKHTLTRRECVTSEAQQIARWIQKQVGVAQWQDRQGRLRTLEYGDIMLLFRNFGNADVFEKALRQAGIAAVTIAGRGFYQQSEINDLLSLLQALVNPYDDLALATALRSPLFALSDATLYTLRQPVGNQRLSLWEALPTDDDPAVRRTWGILLGLQQRAGRVPLAEVLRDVLRQTGYLAILTALPDGTRRRRNVEKLVTLADGLGAIALSDYVTIVNSNDEKEIKESQAVLSAGGAVRLMTIHASKGLESPLVILADTSRGKPPARDVVLVGAEGIGCKWKTTLPWQSPLYESLRQRQQDADAAEEERVIYVAMTRAEECLVISGTLSARSALTGPILKAIGARMEFPEDQPNGDYHFKQTPIAVEVTSLVLPQAMTDSGGKIGTPPVSPLLDAWHSDPIERERHLNASTLAEIGVASAAPADVARYAARRARTSIHASAPEQIYPAIYDSAQIPQRIIGLIVHEALRHWQLPRDADDTRCDALLASYAWQQGIASPTQVDDAVRRVKRLLLNFQTLPIFDAIERAPRVYRELPFTQRVGNRVLHGVIDVLYQQDNEWVIVDYKTGYHEHRTVPPNAFHLQMGAYAQAVAARVGKVPQIFIVYLTRGTLQQILEQEWRAALAAFEPTVQQFLELP